MVINAHLQAVPDLLLCPICFEQYTAPDTLSRMLVNYGHNFCEPCMCKMLARCSPPLPAGSTISRPAGRRPASLSPRHMYVWWDGCVE